MSKNKSEQENLKYMTSEKLDTVVCCFCGDSLNYKDSVQIEIKLISKPEEIQSIFGHKKCLDKVLDKSIPRHPDLLNNE
jgi:hypothetical protein